MSEFALIDDIPKEQLWKVFRQDRNNKLRATDFLAMEDYPFPSADIKTAWRTYRQALRDLPVTSPPTQVEEDQFIVTWPTPPIWPANVV